MKVHVKTEMKKRNTGNAPPAAAAPTPTPAPMETPQAAQHEPTPQTVPVADELSNGVEAKELSDEVVKDGAVAQTIEPSEDAHTEQQPQEVRSSNQVSADARN